MPTVLRIRGYRFFFFSKEGKEPPHVHVALAERYAKVWLEPIAIARSKGFRSDELSDIIRVVRENQGSLLDKWNEHIRNQV